MTTHKQHFDRIETALAAINERVWDINVPLPLPKTQAKWNDAGNEWYVERNGDQWDLIFFDDERWVETGRISYSDDDSLMYAIVANTIPMTRSGELKVKIMGWVSPEWGARAQAALDGRN